MNIKKIKETCIYFKDLEEAKSFYHGKLGLEIINHAYDKHIFFRAGSSVLLCFNPEDSKTKESPPPHFADGPIHFAFEVPANEYDQAKEKIKDLEIEVIDEVEWKGGLRSFYFKDPSGNVLEILPEGVWD